MANEDHMKVFIQGAEAWNSFRENNPDLKPDLSGCNIALLYIKKSIKEATMNDIFLLAFQGKLDEGLNFEDYDFSGVNFEGANLTGIVKFKHDSLARTNLKKANLEGLNLNNLYLEGVDLSNAVLKGANLESSDLTNAIIKNTCLDDTNLKGACFWYANLAFSDFEGSNLEYVDFRFSNLYHAVFLNANFKNANLLGANLEFADLRGANFERTNVTGVKYNKKGKYRGIRVKNCFGSPLFKRFAQDQDYLEEFNDKYPKTYKLWWLVADCGRSFLRWGLVSFILAALFAIIYFILGQSHFVHETPPWNLPTVFYYSMVTFTTLGFGDITPKTNLAAWFVMAEVVLGYIMLGGLISIFANKLARRS